MSAHAELTERRGLRLRPRRPLRAIVGAAVVVVAVAALATVLTGLGKRNPVLMLTRDVAMGERLGAGDLRVVELTSEDAITSVDGGNLDGIVGQYARWSMAAGALLVADGVQPRPLVSPGMALVSVEVAAGSIPPGIKPESPVALVLVAPADCSGNSATTVIEATVIAVGRNLPVEGAAADVGDIVAVSVEVSNDAATLTAVHEAARVSIALHHEGVVVAELVPTSDPDDSCASPAPGFDDASPGVEPSPGSDPPAPNAGVTAQDLGDVLVVTTTTVAG